jgi:hypothetical protein
MEGASPPRNLWKYSCATFVGTDGILLKIHNQKEGCCARSLIATVSHVLALNLTASLRVLIRSLFWFQVLAWLPLIVLASCSPQPSVLLGLNLSSSPVGPPSSKCPTWWRSTFPAMSFWSRTQLQKPFCSSYQRKHYFQSLPFWLHKCHLVSYLGP